MKTRTLFTAVIMSLVPVFGFAASGVHLDSVDLDPTDQASLQRGAKVFMNYCAGCHSADYARYNRMAKDIGLSEEQVSENLIFTTDDNGERTKVGSLIFSNMNKDFGKQAFGTTPPNLALIARSRGTDYLYTYLRTFYLDPSRPVGVNNLAFPGVGMPHVLWKLQGLKQPVYETTTDENGHEHEELVRFETVVEGTLSEEEYDSLVTDLVNFLDYLADPIKVERHRLGIVVMLFLFIFLGVAIMLKKEFWKDVTK
ncbi:cytochrome c1 [Granulosicoccaceae sp. 1_MG-2023]|nr:cytochrome c1 [Granulosicoccaceae sp. 1_MG-2023]